MVIVEGTRNNAVCAAEGLALRPVIGKIATTGIAPGAFRHPRRQGGRWSFLTALTLMLDCARIEPRAIDSGRLRLILMSVKTNT